VRGGRRRARAGLQGRQIIAISRLPAQAHQWHCHATARGRCGKAGGKLRLGLFDSSVEHQRFAALESQCGAGMPKCLRAVEQRQRFNMLTQLLSQHRQPHEQQGRFAGIERHPIQAGACGDRFADFQHHIRNRANIVGFVGRDICCIQRMPGAVANLVLAPGDLRSHEVRRGAAAGRRTHGCQHLSRGVDLATNQVDPGAASQGIGSETRSVATAVITTMRYRRRRRNAP